MTMSFIKKIVASVSSKPSTSQPQQVKLTWQPGMNVVNGDTLPGANQKGGLEESELDTFLACL